MRCRFCGTELPEFSRTCSFCGSEVQTEQELAQKRKMRYEGGPQPQPGPQAGNGWGQPQQPGPQAGNEWGQPQPGPQAGNEWGQPQPGPQAGNEWGQPSQQGPQAGNEWGQPQPGPQAGNEWGQPQPGPQNNPEEQGSGRQPYPQMNRAGRFAANPKSSRATAGGDSNRNGNDDGKGKNKVNWLLIMVSAVILLMVVYLVVSLKKPESAQSHSDSDVYSDSSLSGESPEYDELQEGTEEAYEGQYEQTGDGMTTGVLIGQIVDKETGNPISDARVIFIDEYNTEYPIDAIYTTGSDGSFYIELPEGVYSLEIIKRGYPDYTTGNIYRVENGETTDISILEIQPENTAQQPEDNENSEDSEYILPFSNERYLTDADLDPLSEWELKLARNEIYARHGRRFKDPELQSYFDSKSWYNGRYSPEDFDRNHSSDLSNIKKKNAEYILKYEKDHNYFT